MDNTIQNNIHLKISTQTTETGKHIIWKYKDGALLNQYQLPIADIQSLLLNCAQKQVTHEFIDVSSATSAPPPDAKSNTPSIPSHSHAHAHAHAHAQTASSPDTLIPSPPYVIPTQSPFPEVTPQNC
jgi:hypothetical protein